MLDLLKRNKYILIVVVLIIVAFIWLGSSEEQPELLTSESVVETSAAEQELVDSLLQLRSISLDGTLFLDPAFVSLQDSGVDILSEPIGKRNPFAPLDIPVVSGASAGSGETEALMPPGRQRVGIPGSGKLPLRPGGGEE